MAVPSSKSYCATTCAPIGLAQNSARQRIADETGARRLHAKPASRFLAECNIVVPLLPSRASKGRRAVESTGRFRRLDTQSLAGTGLSSWSKLYNRSTQGVKCQLYGISPYLVLPLAGVSVAFRGPVGQPILAAAGFQPAFCRPQRLAHGPGAA